MTSDAGCVDRWLAAHDKSRHDLCDLTANERFDLYVAMEAANPPITLGWGAE